MTDKNLDQQLDKNTSQSSKQSRHRENTAAWKAKIIPFQEPSISRASWQLVNTLVPYFVLWGLMIWSLSVSLWLTLPLVMLAAGFYVRIFIIFHDCGHGSFFKSKLANDIVGVITGLLTFTSYHHWKWEHSIHHATSGHLDKRGTGDVWTMTVQEYLEASRWKKFAYRLARNPFILFCLAPLFLFLVLERFPSSKAQNREKYATYLTNMGLTLIAGVLIYTIGLKAYLLIQLSTLGIAVGAGVWLFYVQHQFEGVYWEREDSWDYTTAALQGSSFYKLPRILQWFTGNIGFHHIHHLSSRIPNYNLEKCHKEIALFQEVKPITLLSSLKSLRFRLWDEQQRKLVGFSYLKKFKRNKAA